MSASAPSDLYLEKQVIRLRQAIADTEKLQAETQKFVAERDKLAAEARKFGRERFIQTLLAITGLVGGLVTVAQLLLRFRS